MASVPEKQISVVLTGIFTEFKFILVFLQTDAAYKSVDNIEGLEKIKWLSVNE